MMISMRKKMTSTTMKSLMRDSLEKPFMIASCSSDGCGPGHSQGWQAKRCGGVDYLAAGRIVDGVGEVAGRTLSGSFSCSRRKSARPAQMEVVVTQAAIMFRGKAAQLKKESCASDVGRNARSLDEVGRGVAQDRDPSPSAPHTKPCLPLGCQPSRSGQWAVAVTTYRIAGVLVNGCGPAVDLGAQQGARGLLAQAPRSPCRIRHRCGINGLSTGEGCCR
ncbi:hypothetical protein FH972_026383 [Carpinus fangiana]|uniref:Uncharacterized protein n=1 Tax=Carpinus fangiana TaxID=176857 RepID=A0A5N6L461_9ROSI|nr:hypothetical protein FH972_026383 [Carpinus fangiana]